MTIEMRESFNAFMFCSPWDEIRRGPDSELAHTLLLMGDAEMAGESAQQNRSGVARYFVNVR
jgi:hypothetical protein